MRDEPPDPPGDEPFDNGDEFDDLGDDYDDLDGGGYDDEAGGGFEDEAGGGFEDGLDPLDEHESALVRQDLVDLERFFNTFGPEGFRGVSVYCHDCAEEHYYPWDMLRENLRTLLDTGETPVHEPAFAPDPDQYVPWEYARGYVDALQDVGVDQRADVGVCRRCGFEIPSELRQGNFCPRCGTPLMSERLRQALGARGLRPDDVSDVLRESGLPD
jgi:RNase P subunit RPR2